MRSLRTFLFAFAFLVQSAGAMSGKKALENPFLGKDTWTLESFQDGMKSLPETTLYFVSNREGITGPCGCSVNPKGGLDRSQNFVQKNNVQEQWAFNTGNALFPSVLRSEKDEKTWLRNAESIAKAYQKMGFDAHNVGELDLSMGLSYLKSLAKKYAMSFVSANVATAEGQLFFPEFLRLKNSAGQKVLVSGLSHFNQLDTNEIQLLDPLTSFRKLLSQWQDDEMLVLLSDLPSLENEKLIKLSQRPFMILGAKELSSFETPQQEKAVLFWSIQNQGQQWGRLQWKGIFSARAWFSPQVVQIYADRWNQLAADRRGIASLKSSVDRDQELHLLDQKLKKIGQFAPLKKRESNVHYRFELIDMDDAYKL